MTITLSKEQREVVEASLDEKTVVMAAAASGKTRSAIERLKFLLKQGVDPSKIVLVTFTNNAGAEMSQRIDPKEREGLFVGTIHSYANALLTFQGIDTTEYRDEDRFDELFELIYETPKCYKEIDYLIVDEAQDLNTEQFDFLETLNPKGFLYVGDVRQSIYGFKSATPKRLLALMKRDDVVVRELTTNYRNSKKILDYSNNIIKKMKGIALTPIKGVKTNAGHIQQISRFELIPILMRDQNWSNWAILCRANRTVNQVVTLLNRNNIPAITFRQAQGGLEELQANLDKNAVKVLTTHSCMTGDTLVHTSNGVKRIDEVVNKKDYDELIYNGEELSRVENFIENGVQPVKSIITQYGNNIKLTDNHDVIIVTKDGLQKKKVIDLSGDEELLLRKNITYDVPLVSLSPVNKKELDVRTELWDEPSFLTEDLAELIGMYTADGTANKSSIHYCKEHIECCERFAELVQKCFGKEIFVKKGDKHHKNMYKTECHSVHILTFLKQNFNGIDSHNKFISDKILQGGEKIWKSFLRGLFEDGTVHLKNNKFDHICLTFKNDKMKEQLQTILLALGIDPVFKQYKSQKNINNLQIYSNGAEVFKEIGFITEFKQERLDNHQSKRYIKNKSLVLKEVLLEYEPDLTMTKSNRNNLRNRKTSALTEQTINTLYKNNTKYFNSHPRLMEIYHIFQEYQIEKIEQIIQLDEEPTYCLEMQGKSQFVQNGFLMGNSKGLEFDKVIIMDSPYGSQEAIRLNYVAVTRAKEELYLVRK